MIDFALLSLPIFGVVALGWVAVRSRLAAIVLSTVVSVATVPLAAWLVRRETIDRVPKSQIRRQVTYDEPPPSPSSSRE
jgi:hypothetical protein